MKKVLLLLVAVIAVAAIWLLSDEDAADGIKKEAQLKALEVLGDAAADRMASAGDTGQATHGSAVDLINEPIEIRQISDRVYYATGVGNTFMIKTDKAM